MLVTTVVVNGVEMHLQAIEIASDEGMQRVAPDWEEALAKVHEAVGADGHWQTIELDGREYVLIGTALC